MHLIGGGRDASLTAAVLAPFVDEARAASSGDPVIALLLVLEPDDRTAESRFRTALEAAGAPASGIRVHAIREGERFAASVVSGVHGIFVGGGLTPAYHQALTDIAEPIRGRVAAGAPYAGFSAGAVIAAAHALVGGHRLDERDVAPADAAEELEQLEVRDGLGLVRATVEVHAAQWGTLSRLVAAVEADLVPRGVAIDEHTAYVVDGLTASVHGRGHVWSVDRARCSARVTLLRP
ncbi:hypothetical protein GCM10022200_14340 [Microbacterium awajiense]|uniref:Cyanophycinase n=1 Tax=Microbacterium awajiense TaxID=415214 RepID=A0ABP7AHP3_9MICO